MRAIVLLSISAGVLLACGKAQTVELTARLRMSQVPGDWCGSTNPDNIRLDCAFEVGLYVVDASRDAGTEVLSGTCVKMDRDPMRVWKNFHEDLNSAMAKLERINVGTVRVELAAIEPPQLKNC